MQLPAPGASSAPTLTRGLRASCESRHGGFMRTGCNCDLCELLLSQLLPMLLAAAAMLESTTIATPSSHHGFISSCQLYFFWPASSPTNPPLLFSRGSICNIWRRLCLKRGPVLQSRAQFTTTPPFPSLCSGIHLDPNLWIFMLWKEL